MEVSKLEDNGNIIKEVSSSLSKSSSEFEKDIGNTHVLQKSSSMESEECSRMISQSSSDIKDSEIKQETEPSGEIKQDDLKLTLQEIISEIEENINGKDEHSIAQDITLECKLTEEEELPLIEKKEEEIVKFQTALQDYPMLSTKESQYPKIDRQTSTTSLEDQQCESNPASVLGLLSKDVGKRPHSLPANLAHLWQSLKIANELNQSLPPANSAVNGDDSDQIDPEASGHQVNIEDGLHSKSIDLEKLFTPASDSGEITPSRNRKIYASSSFYSPNHPTMEEQVELARRISHSLSDISNRESKGQSMYVNRKKRSVKWVHEGEGHAAEPEIENIHPSLKKETKPPLKLVMNPRGQVQDFTMLRKQGFVVDPMAPLSPDVCFDLVRDLNAPRGKGAELFAKRRKKSENWIIDENNVKTPDTATVQSPLSKLPPPSYLQGSTQRAENVQKMNQIQEKFSQPRLKLIKSPWEAALEGSVESAFQEVRHSPRGVLMAPTPTTLKLLVTPPPPSPTVKEDLYKPKPPRAWNPQPPCKSFSSVKLEKIFAGSPRSPVSLAYHPETNTISTEPVIVENVPPIATELSGYDVIDESILHEPKTRSPHEFLIYEPVVSKTMDIPCPKMGENTIVQSKNSQSLDEEESNKAVVEGNVKLASQTIEKKVKFRLDEEIESCDKIDSEEITKNYSSNDIKQPDSSSSDVRWNAESNNSVSNDEIIGIPQDSIIANTKTNLAPSETMILSSVPSLVVESNITEKISETSSEFVSSKTHFSDKDVTKKTHNNCSSQSQMEHETESADEEVEDLCEREFNELSLEYEKVQKPELKKPAAQVAGAVPIFSSIDFSNVQKLEEPTPQVEKKSFRKPGSLVPGAKPLFGNALGDIHVSINDSDGSDKPYEKIPVKSLISTFEQSTRPLLKYKQVQDKIPDAVSPNKFLYKEGESEQKRKYEDEGIIKEHINITSLTENITHSSNETGSKDIVEDTTNDMKEEEIQKINQHYELQRQKKEIYDQQMQKYKEEMKKLRSVKTRSQEPSEQKVKKIQDKQLSTPKISNSEQLKFLNNRSHHEDGQTNLVFRSEESTPKMPTNYEATAYTTSTQASGHNYFGQNNFNTAPRGWQKSMAYYRPVTFKQSAPAYTDF